MSKQIFEKALIKILAGSKSNKDKKEKQFEVLFNPTEYTHTIGNTFEEKKLPGRANPILQFVNGNVQSLSMDLFFDTWTNKTTKDLPGYLKNLTEMLTIDEALHAPPPVEFVWGKFSFQAYVESITQKFTMFDPGGDPVRATLSVSFKHIRSLKDQLKNPRLNSSDKTKRSLFSVDDSLWAIAEREYGEPRYWRKIAKYNGIRNPRLLRPGTIVLLPPLETLNALE